MMRSWDRMQVALPFGRGIFIWGEPIDIGTDLDEAGIGARPAVGRAVHARHGRRRRGAGRARHRAAAEPAEDKLRTPELAGGERQ